MDEEVDACFGGMQLRHGPYPAGFTREILHSEHRSIGKFLELV
jgi:hypothetical protein